MKMFLLTACWEFSTSLWIQIEKKIMKVPVIETSMVFSYDKTGTRWRIRRGRQQINNSQLRKLGGFWIWIFPKQGNQNNKARLCSLRPEIKEMIRAQMRAAFLWMHRKSNIRQYIMWNKVGWLMTWKSFPVTQKPWKLWNFAGHP